MLRHCIIGVDYSPEWEHTLAHLPAIKALLGIESLTLVHVIESFKRQRTQDQPGAIEGYLQSLSDRISAELGVSVDHEVRSGFAASEIIAVANERNADGIIALNRSHSASREKLVGNIVINLARMSKLPLLVLASDGVITGTDAPVILGTDGSVAAQAAQRWFETLVKGGNPGLALWVSADQLDNAEQAEQVLTALDSSFAHVSTRQLQGDATEQLVNTASEEKAALVIIGKRGSTPIQELLIGSTAESVVRESRQPVLMIPA